MVSAGKTPEEKTIPTGSKRLTISTPATGYAAGLILSQETLTSPVGLEVIFDPEIEAPDPVPPIYELIKTLALRLMVQAEIGAQLKAAADEAKDPDQMDLFDTSPSHTKH